MSNHAEICTLQFGHYSNFIGTHWWNIQEHGFSFSPDEKVEINNKILYREGQTLKGDPTYTPRLLVVDLKGSLGSLSTQGDLYHPERNARDFDVSWHENSVDVRREQEIPKNEYLRDLDVPEGAERDKKYDFESTVNVWSDFLYARFHPKTVKVVNEYRHDGDSFEFNVFPLGRNLWKTERFTEEFCDDIRYFVEECDNLQGFQIIQDATNAFSGLSSSCLEHLRDEYDRKSILVFPVLPSHYTDYDYDSENDERKSQMNDCLRIVNLAMCFHDLSEQSSMFVPLSTMEKGWRKPHSKRTFKYVNYNEKLMYHTSSILAMALDTFTLRYRLKQQIYGLNDLSYDFCQHGRKLVAASLCLPFVMNPTGDLLDCLDQWQGPLSQSITPNYTLESDRTLNMLAVRGIPPRKLKRPPQNAGKQRNVPAYRCESVEEMIKFYLSCTSFGSASQVVAMEKPLVIKTPTPNIFDENIDVHGMLGRRNLDDRVKSVPLLAGLHSGDQLGDTIGSLLEEVQKLKFRRYHQFLEAGLETDEYTEGLSKLMDFRDCYKNDYLL